MKENTINFAAEPRQPAGRGKIARLPAGIREQLNQRLLDGQSAPMILPWLNRLPSVIEILAAQFSGQVISAQNLSNWRIAGYQHWLRDRKDLDQIKQFGDHAAAMSPVRRDHIVSGVLTMASARIFESLRATVDAPISPADMAKIARAVVPLVYAEESKTRLKILKKKVNIKDDQLELMREKLHRKAGKSRLIKVNHG